MNRRLVGRVLLPMHEWLKGKPTLSRLRELEQSQWEPAERLRAFQHERVRDLLRFAHAHSPYYRRVIDEAGLDPARGGLEALERLPYLTRELIRTHFDDIRSRAALRGVHRRSSGGSTGEPVTVLVDMGRMGMQEAARLRAHRWFELEPGAREVVLWGSPIELTHQDRLRTVRDWLLNSTLLSAFDLGEPALARHAAAIGRLRPEKLYGYASAIHLLAEYLERTRTAAPAGLRAVFTTAEPLHDFQRATIERVLGCPVSVEYGCRDGGLVALECPKGGLHVAAEGMVVEIADPGPDGRGEIVLTNLDSHAFPIIRYRTGDIGRLAPDPCPCGRGLPCLASVEGRRTDFLVTPEGRVLHALSVIYVLRDMPVVREFRFVQESLRRVRLEIALARPLLAEEEADLRAGLGRLLGPAVTLEVATVARIARTPSGKFRYVESRVADSVLAEMLAAVGPLPAPGEAAASPARGGGHV